MENLNNCAKDMLKKACEIENGKIVSRIDTFGGKIIEINDKIYTSSHSKYQVMEAFNQLIENKYVEYKMVSNEQTYYITKDGYEKIKSIDDIESDDILVI